MSKLKKKKSRPSRPLLVWHPCISISMLWLLLVWAWAYLPDHRRWQQQMDHWLDVVPVATNFKIFPNYMEWTDWNVNAYWTVRDFMHHAKEYPQPCQFWFKQDDWNHWTQLIQDIQRNTHTFSI